MLGQQSCLKRRSRLACRQEERRFQIDHGFAIGDLAWIRRIENPKVRKPVLHSKAQAQDLRAQAGSAHAQQQRVAIAAAHLLGQPAEVGSVGRKRVHNP